MIISADFNEACTVFVHNVPKDHEIAIVVEHGTRVLHLGEMEIRILEEEKS